MAVHVMTLPERRRAIKAHARLGLFGSRNYSRGLEGIDATLSWLFRTERYRLGLELWGSDYAAACFGNPDNGVHNA